ncbi:TRAP transporter large permease [Alkalicoccus saliphilus]|uniref:C4-dicarboxylate ABC transporter permease n=1 Tax=Alkalicoccus saliphilus TaxID=200989 RepID=A0A2T4U4P2_9BACI|nr:TRAP transporter large permease [Alkalicoccus saliphilus]PTL38370.1 C4-dicarboxylate ABC transporter permease [Alkalicoccus saliphilus]
MILLFFISLFIFLFLSVPVAVALGLSTMLGIIMSQTLDLSIVPQRMLVSLNSFPLMAIPFFILAGGLMQSGGIAKRLIDFSTKLVGHFHGGLAMVAIVTAMFFAAISGSGTATVIAIGTIMIPAMIGKGYNTGFASSNVAVSGALGIVIPPSIPLILYGISAEVSISDMFLAGIVPGIIMGLSLLIYAYIYSKNHAKKNNLPKEPRCSFKDLLKSFVVAVPALAMPVIVLGGIYGGVFTPTEASIIAVAYAFVIGFIYRELNFKKLVNTLINSSITTSIIMIIIGTSGAFSFFIQINGIPQMLSNYMGDITTNPYVFLIIINIFLLLVGMVIEGSAAILILTPLLLPLAVGMGIDPVHFGIIMVVNLAIGLVTPPIGLNLFAASQISKISISAISKSTIPFIIVMILAVLLISFLPIFSIWFKLI